MAAQKLDQLWDGWMTDLGRSYPKTLALLAQDKLDDATTEYRTGCLAVVKKLYSEAAKTYPLRFSKAETWCIWTRDLYVLSSKIDKALKQKDVKLAQDLMAQMRTHFYLLHQETKTLNANDWIYAFDLELHKDTPSADALKEIVTQFKEAKPCLLAQNKDVETLYAQAKEIWLATVTPVLKAESLSDADLAILKEAAEVFYTAYGSQFE